MGQLLLSPWVEVHGRSAAELVDSCATQLVHVSAHDSVFA